MNAGLEGNEYASLLGWVMKTYPYEELMSHPDLRVDLSNVAPLLKPEVLKQLEHEYLMVK